MGTRTLSLALVFLLAGVFPAVGEETSAESPKPVEKVEVKERTLADLIQDILLNGRAKTLDKHTSGNLGLDKTPTPMKFRNYPSSMTLDGWSHGMGVFYKKDEDDRRVATSIILQITKVTKLKNGRRLKGKGYRFSPEGKLLNAMKVTGIVGKLKQKRLSVGSKRIKKAFKKEMNFWLKDMADIEYK